jgi:hypothetical protein
MRRAVALAAALAVAGCAHHLRPPSSSRWGLPVYPGASFDGASTSKASVAIYSTSDRLDDVDAWYAAELPPGTMHAKSESKREATFALFDARSQRTVHLLSDGRTTMIQLTDLTE